MAYKRAGKTMGSPVITVALGVALGVVLQLALAAVAAMFVEKGSVPERGMPLMAAVIRIIGVLSAAVIAWIMEADKKFLYASISAGTILFLSVIGSMLFWSIDSSALAVGAAVSLAAFGACILVLSRMNGRTNRHRIKKRYR